MGKIAVLDQNMINMIAAGEVIERPASVVKELMENSIDAGAAKINVVIEDGGRKLISISDNGAGMDSTDLMLAFEPHATSKLKNSQDLHNITSLGFRGEALASIGSIANVRAVSRINDSLNANCIEIDCGSKNGVSPCNGDFGTTIQVRDIFYKLPARRKFLKTATTEMEHITETFRRIVLVNPNVEFTLTHNNKLIYHLSANSIIKQRIAELFSMETSQNLIETECSEKGMKIYALMGTPSISKTSNNMQYVFINGRFIKDKFISHAVKEAYRGSIDQIRFPVLFLYINMPCEDYDVNVHPTKIEVRFYNSNLVHSQILGCLREKLLSTNYDTMAVMPPVEGRNQTITDAIDDFFKRHRPAHSQREIDFDSRPKSYSQTGEPKHTEHHEYYSPRPSFIAPEKKHMQIHESFIIAQTHDGFIIVDQHALHERIMVENLRKKISSNNLESQRLLIPASLTITDAQQELLNENVPLLEKLGIELAPFGPKTIAIQAFPVILSKADPIDFLKDLIDLLCDKQLIGNHEKLLDKIINMAACKAAIKAGNKLSDAEIEDLLSQRENIELSGSCPHGRPTSIKFSLTELEKQFKRT